MIRRMMVLYLLLILAPAPAVRGQQLPPPAPEPPKISVQLRDVPFRTAVGMLFQSTGYQFSVNPEVNNLPVSLVLKDVQFDAAVRLLVRQASITQPGLFFSKDQGVYVFDVRKQTQRADAPTLEKIPIQFQNAGDLVKQLERVGATRELDSVDPVPTDNSLLVRGTPELIQQLKAAIRLIDVPARMLSVRVGVTGPGTGGKPLQLASTTRTINGKEVVVDEQMTANGELARLRVQVRPLIQGDGEVLAESDWDLSVPVAGGPKGPIRLIKRLTTTARLHSGRGVTVGEVDLAPFGGAGTVRLWLRAEILETTSSALAVSQFGESLGTVQLFGGKPYVLAYALTDELGGQLRRSAPGTYEIRPGLPKGPELLPAAELPPQPGPFRLTRSGRVVSQDLIWVAAGTRTLRPDAQGDPMLPLDDVARFLGGRVQYDSASDRYQIQGGKRLGAFRFPSIEAAAGK